MKNIIKIYDTQCWKKDLETKSSITYYKLWKGKIDSEEQLYENNNESIILFRARSNTLGLNWRNKYKNLSTIYLLTYLLLRFSLVGPPLSCLRTFWRAVISSILLSCIFFL